MKIRKLEEKNRDKAIALIKTVFPKKKILKVIENLHTNKKDTYEWVCIHKNMYVAYVIFTKAFNAGKFCGYHLTTIAVNPEYQKMKIGSQLMQFALRQEMFNNKPIFAIRGKQFLEKFGFTTCTNPACYYPVKKGDFLALNNKFKERFTIGCEEEIVL